MNQEIKKISSVKKSLVRELFLYFKDVSYRAPSMRQTFGVKIIDIIKLWSLGLLFSFAAVFMSTLVFRSAGLGEPENALGEFFLSSPLFLIIIIVFIWGPISEELTFRLALFYSPYRLAISLVFLLFLFLELFFFFSPGSFTFILAVFSSLGPFWGLLLFFLLITLASFSLGFLIKHSGQSAKIESFYQKHFRVIFYSSATIFALLHFFNFVDSRAIWFLAPILAAPQFFLGLIMGYIRMNYGFAWTLFFHFFHNTIISLPALLFLQINNDKFTEYLNKGGSLPVLSGLEMVYFIIGSFLSLATFVLVLFSLGVLFRNWRRTK